MSNVINLGLIGLGETPYTAADFDAAIAKCDPEKTLFIDIHSEGGSVFEGFGMFNAIRAFEGKTVARIKVLAASIASYIAMACDEIEIADNGFFMVHNPYSATEGDDKAHAQNAKLLAELKQSMIESYSNRTGMKPAEIEELMSAESYIGSSQAIQLGLADRVIESTKPQSRQLPKSHLPTLVLACMYGKSGGKQPAATPKENEMSTQTQQPVAATVRKIKSAFPKASSDFIVKCMDEELDMEEVGEEFAKSMEDENEELLAKVAAMEEEIEAFKAKAVEDDEAIAKAKAEEEEEEEAIAKAKRNGVTPVARTSDGSPNPVALWNSAIDAELAKGKTRLKAVMAVNKANPGLRQSFVDASN